MSTFEVRVVRIDAIEPIEGADAIELAVVGDYRSVVRKGQYNVGDIAVYIPEQAVLPDDLIEAMGLTGKLAGSGHNRVKAVKLRGCLSQGILYPTTWDSLTGWSLEALDGQWVFPEEGDNVADILGITKYEPVIPTHLSGEVYNAGQRLTVSYDIENFKKYPHVLIEGEEVVYTEKLHGTFCGVGVLPIIEHGGEHIRNKFVVFSKGLGADGLCFKDNEANVNNVYMRALFANNVFDKLEVWANHIRLKQGEIEVPVLVLGEVYGPGVQTGFTYGSDLKFRLFDVVVGYRGDQRYLSVDSKLAFARASELDTVPFLYRGPFSKETMYAYTDGQETVSGKNTHMREGVVVTPVNERRDDEIGRVILKSVSAAYLLRKGNTTEYQ